MPLNFRRSGHYEDLVECLRAAGFEQEGDVEQQRGRVAIGFDKMLADGLHLRMDDGFERREFVGIAEHALRQLFPVEHAVANRSGEALSDRRDQSRVVGLQVANDGVRIENGHSGALEHLRNGRLSHADRPGEGEANHGRRF